MHIGGASEHQYNLDARESGIIEEIRLETAVRDPDNEYTWIDTVLLTWCKREPLLEVLLNTRVTGVRVAGGAIAAVTASNAGTETVHEIAGKMFVDGTGHGTLGYLAGAEFRMGREARSEHGESLAPEIADRWTLGASIMFRAEDTGKPVPYVPPPWARSFASVPPPRPVPGRSRNHDRYWHDDTCGWWWIEHGGRLDAIRDNDAIRDELHAIIHGLWDYTKNHHPDSRVREAARTFAITWIGAIPGHRESRRLLGDHVMTQHDVLGSTVFDDQVAVGGWSIDLHPPGGFDDPAPPSSHAHPDLPYTIPFRSIYSRNVANLLVASRCLSVTHVAHGSTRLIGTLALVGQAAGTAAHLCIARSLTPRQLAASREDIAALQQALLAGDAWLIGIPGNDPLDKARAATVTATSEHPCRFDGVDDWIPLHFPLAQRFWLGRTSDSTAPPALSICVKSTADRPVLVTGGFRREVGRVPFTSTVDVARFECTVPAGFEGWQATRVVRGSLDMSVEGPCWVYLDAADDGLAIAWGLNRFHWPGTCPGFYNDDEGRWMLHRGRGVPFLSEVIGPRGTFCLAIENAPSPYPARAVVNGFARPFAGSNAWISAPFKETYRVPAVLHLDPERVRDHHGIDTPRPGTELVLDFHEQVAIHQVWLTFDTDLDNAFPHKNYGRDRIKDWPVIGHAPNCIADMDILVDSGDGEARLVATVRDNHQRRVKVSLPGGTAARRLILRPVRNWGFHCFGMYEVRVY